MIGDVQQQWCERHICITRRGLFFADALYLLAMCVTVLLFLPGLNAFQCLYHLRHAI